MSLRRGLFVLAFACAGAASTAALAADEGTVSEALSPNAAGAASSLSVMAKGPFAAQGAPTALKIITQKGFATSPRSVASLCTAAQESGDACPAASRIGSGTAVATGTVGAINTKDNITFTLYLGVPAQHGDIASILISGSDSVLHQTVHATGRLFRASTGGSEILFDPLPQFTPPPGTTVTLDSLSMQAGATRTVSTGSGKRRKLVRYSLITNPPSCPRGGWSSVFTITFGAGRDVARTLRAPCRPAAKR